MEKNQEWKDWGIKEHWNIPEKLLEDMAATPGFDINYVREAAAGHVTRYARPTDEGSRDPIEDFIVTLRDESIPLLIKMAQSPMNHRNLILYGQILEYCMVADAMEEFLRNQSTGDPDGEQS